MKRPRPKIGTALCVDFGPIEDDVNGVNYPNSWQVSVDIDEPARAILWGFARKVDAEIAMRFLLSLKVDWTLPSRSLWRQLAKGGYPTREKLMEAACEHLQW